jgi:ATP-dependent DNA ligase
VEATQDNHDAFVHMGFEGTVMKLKTSTYQHGTRGKGWFKIKAVHDMDVVIVGYVPGHNSNFGKVGSLILAQPLGLQNAEVVTDASKFLQEILRRGKVKLAKGETAELPKIDMELIAEHNLGVRACARGFDEDLMDRITAEPEAYFGKVVSITHNGLMAGGLKVRHPQFHRFREDKRIEDTGWHHR